MQSKFQVFKAFDRTPLRWVDADTYETLEAKLAGAAHVFKNKSLGLPKFERIRILNQSALRIEERQHEFAKLIASEGGKPLMDAKVEVTRAIDGLRNAADELRNFSGQEIPMGLTAASENRWAFTTKEPLGIVAAISAFNHPLNLIVHQVAPAVAVGCPVIIKPSSMTPLSCIELVKVLIESGLPKAWCQTLITEDNALAEALAVDTRIAFMSFIGSAKVGWYLKSKLAPGTRCALEHGGCAPLIVDKSADLKRAVTAVTKGGYYHAGQVCVSVQRVYVHKDVFKEFTDQLKDRVLKLKVGDPLSDETEVGPLIHPKETERVELWIEEAVSEGAELIGGGRVNAATLMPAILVKPSLHSKVSTQEIFGPVTCVFEFEKLSEAIASANDLPLAFQSSIFSQDIHSALEAAKDFEASAVMINDHTAFRTDWMPFAGLKQSGYGTGGIGPSMRDMTYEKMIVLGRS